MPSCAYFLGLVCVFAFGAARSEAGDASRTAPTRPGASVGPSVVLPPKPIKTIKLDGVEYVAVSDAADTLALKFTTLDPGKRVAIGERPARAVLEAGSREALVEGMRVFLGEPVLARSRQLYLSRIDYERCLTPQLRPGFGVPLLALPRVIALDPGHGGIDIGASNPRIGIYEKNLTLDVALRVQKLLARDGYRVVLTRTEDKLPAPKVADLAMRSEIANRAHADLFVSIHFNVVERDPQNTRGIEVYTFAPARQHAAEWWSTFSRSDSSLETAEQPVNRFDHWSNVLVGTLHRSLLQTLKTSDRGKKIAHWGVLRGLNCPGVLVEPAVISNDAEARRLATPQFRQEIADAIAVGIRDYVSTLEAARAASGAVATSGK